MAKNLLVAQSGGPTAAINATLSGIIDKAMESEKIDRIYGARYGIQGVLSENFIDLKEKLRKLSFAEFGEARLQEGIQRILHRLSVTPAAALGSCRYKLRNPEEDPGEFEELLRIFKTYDIAYFVYIGGNDSMDTVAKLSKFMEERGERDITIVGAPKTIDNDLFGIDHCPGFGSAAKYIVSSLSELERELVVYDTEYVILVEMMGRNAGWLTAAAALSEGRNSEIPYLIYLQEVAFDFGNFIRDLREKLKKHKQVIVAVSEGIRDARDVMICDYASAPALSPDGKTASEQTRMEDAENLSGLDAFGHKIASGAAKILEQAVQREIGCKVRSIELNLLQRCAGHILSETDLRESGELGRNAVKLAVEGRNGFMSSLRRVHHPELSKEECGEEENYEVEYFPVEIGQAANREKKVPREWINAAGNNVEKECIYYLKPLIQGEVNCEFSDGIPNYVVLF